MCSTPPASASLWTEDRLGRVPLALTLGVAALMVLGSPFRRSVEGSRSRFYLAFTGSAIASSWWNRAAAGATTNTIYPALVGKPSHAHWAAITDTSGLWDTNLDVQRGGKNDPRREIIMDELRAAVASQRFDAIILDDYAAERRAFWDDLLAPYYELDRQAFADANVFWTVSGSPARPQLVYVPKRP